MNETGNNKIKEINEEQQLNDKRFEVSRNIETRKRSLKILINLN